MKPSIQDIRKILNVIEDDFPDTVYSKTVGVVEPVHKNVYEGAFEGLSRKQLILIILMIKDPTFEVYIKPQTYEKLKEDEAH